MEQTPHFPKKLAEINRQLKLSLPDTPERTLAEKRLEFYNSRVSVYGAGMFAFCGPQRDALDLGNHTADDIINLLYSYCEFYSELLQFMALNTELEKLMGGENTDWNWTAPTFSESERGFGSGDWEFYVAVDGRCVKEAESILRSDEEPSVGLVEKVSKLEEKVLASPHYIWWHSHNVHAFVRMRVLDLIISERDKYRVERVEKAIVEVPIESLPEDKRECGICQEDYCPGDEDGGYHMPAELHCGHVFGGPCLAIWLRQKFNCPYRCEIDQDSGLSLDSGVSLDMVTILDDVNWKNIAREDVPAW